MGRASPVSATEVEYMCIFQLYRSKSLRYKKIISLMNVKFSNLGNKFLTFAIAGGNIFRCFPDLGQEAAEATKRRRVADRPAGIYRWQ